MTAISFSSTSGFTSFTPTSGITLKVSMYFYNVHPKGIKKRKGLAWD
jgi:hypothetical protein